MTSKQRAFLRGMAQNLTPIFQVGKGGITENFINQINEALEAREIIKISILGNSPETARDVASELSLATGSEPVQVVGKKVTLYRRSVKMPEIELP